MTQSVFGRNPLFGRWTNGQEPSGPCLRHRTHPASIPNAWEVRMNRSLTILIGLAIAGVLVAGCGSAKKTAASTPPTSLGAAMADLTGTWSGQGAIQGREAPVALRLVQNGS